MGCSCAYIDTSSLVRSVLIHSWINSEVNTASIHKSSILFTGHEHDKHGAHDEVTGMPVHRHSLQKDPRQVIKEVKKAIEDREGCQVIEFPIFGFFESILLHLPHSTLT